MGEVAPALHKLNALQHQMISTDTCKTCSSMHCNIKWSARTLAEHLEHPWRAHNTGKARPACYWRNSLISHSSLQGHTSCRLAHHGETSDSHMDRTNSWLAQCIETTQFSVQTHGEWRGRTSSWKAVHAIWYTDCSNTQWDRKCKEFSGYFATLVGRKCTSLQLSCCRNTALEYTPQHFALLSNSSTAAHATCCTNYRIAQWISDGWIDLQFATLVGQKYTSLQLHSRRLL